MSTNPLLLSVARDYLAIVKALASGGLDHTALHDAEGQRGLLHAQLIELAPLRDKHDAERDGIAHARRVLGQG